MCQFSSRSVRRFGLCEWCRETHTQTDTHTNIRVNIGIKPTFFNVVFCGSRGMAVCGLRWLIISLIIRRCWGNYYFSVGDLPLFILPSTSFIFFVIGSNFKYISILQILLDSHFCSDTQGLLYTKAPSKIVKVKAEYILLRYQIVTNYPCCTKGTILRIPLIISFKFPKQIWFLFYSEINQYIYKISSFKHYRNLW